MFTRNRSNLTDRFIQSVQAFIDGPAVVCALSGNSGTLAVALAETLIAPVEVLVVRHIPGAGAVSESGGFFADPGAKLDTDYRQFSERMLGEAESAHRVRMDVYEFLPSVNMTGAVALLVLQSEAPDSVLRAAVAELRSRGAKRVVAAAPALPEATIAALFRYADEVVVPVQLPTQWPAPTLIEDLLGEPNSPRLSGVRFV
jgi:putative phosphoribosyl transferase